jgi:UDP-3-O-[3-hydroxymyristoyl] glucosamine N-acyltransferase
LGGKIVRSGQMVWGTPARSMDKFKEQYVWYTRLPELAARIKELEGKVGGKL